MAPARTIFITITLAGFSAEAQLTAPPAGATQLGLAGAAVAGRPDPTALWSNPALLVDSRSGLSASLGIQRDRRSLQPSEENSDRDYGTQLGKDAGEPGLSPAVALSQMFWSRRIWAALGYRQRLRHRSYYLRSSALFVAAAEEQPVHDPLRYLGSELSVTDHELSFAVASAAIKGRVHLGAAVALDVVSLGYRRTLWAGFADDPQPLLGAPAESARHDVDAALQLDGLGVTLRAGLVVVLTRWLQVGFSSEISLASLDGDLALTRCDVAQPSCHPVNFQLDATGGAASLTLHQPATLTFGVAIAPWQRLTLYLGGSYTIAPSDPLSADVDKAQVSVTSEQTDSYPLSSLPLGISFRNTFSVRTAVEIALIRTFLWLRGGWALHGAAGAKELPSAVMPPLNQHLLAFGLLARRGRFTLVIGVGHRLSEALETEAVEATLVNPLDASEAAVVGAGRYDSHSTAASLELQVSW